MTKLKRLSDGELDYLNPTNDINIKNYLAEIKKLDDELTEYLNLAEIPSLKDIHYYESMINLKWDNLRFYKKYMNK